MRAEQMIAAFDRTPVPWGDDGKMVRGLIVRCPCGAAHPLRLNEFHNAVTTGREYDAAELTFVRKKLQPQGWVIGRSKREHRCPKCNALRPTSKEEIKKGRYEPMLPKEMPKIVEPPKVEEPKQEPVPVAKVVPLSREARAAIEPAPTTERMSREDRRIIFAKISDVYVNDRVGYSKGWSDERVSADLSVPIAWVTEVREQFMGEEHISYAVRAELRDARDVVKTIRALEGEFKRLLAFAEKMEATLIEIDKVIT